MARRRIASFVKPPETWSQWFHRQWLSILSQLSVDTLENDLWAWNLAVQMTWCESTEWILQYGYIDTHRYWSIHCQCVNQANDLKFQPLDIRHLMNCLTECRIIELKELWKHRVVEDSIGRPANRQKWSDVHEADQDRANDPIIEEVYLDDPRILLKQCGIDSLASFRRWALKGHPDRGGDTDLFQRVNNAMTLVHNR